MDLIFCKQKKILTSFNFFSSWEEKYQYIQTFTLFLFPFPNYEKNQKNLIIGCQSQAWFMAKYVLGYTFFFGYSTSPLILAFLGLFIYIYSSAIESLPIQKVSNCLVYFGLEKYLSSTRQQGLYNILTKIFFFLYK